MSIDQIFLLSLGAAATLTVVAAALDVRRDLRLATLSADSFDRSVARWGYVQLARSA